MSRPLPELRVVLGLALRDKKRPPGRLEVSRATALAACMSPEESIPAEARALPKARSEHTCSDTQWERCTSAYSYVVLAPVL